MGPSHYAGFTGLNLCCPLFLGKYTEKLALPKEGCSLFLAPSSSSCCFIVRSEVGSQLLPFPHFLPALQYGLCPIPLHNCSCKDHQKPQDMHPHLTSLEIPVSKNPRLLSYSFASCTWCLHPFSALCPVSVFVPPLPLWHLCKQCNLCKWLQLSAVK